MTLVEGLVDPPTVPLSELDKALRGQPTSNWSSFGWFPGRRVGAATCLLEHLSWRWIWWLSISGQARRFLHSLDIKGKFFLSYCSFCTITFDIEIVAWCWSCLCLSQQIPSHQEAKLHERLKEVADLKGLLAGYCPEKLLLWKRLLDWLPFFGRLLSKFVFVIPNC